MAKKRVQRTTLLLFIFIISSFLFSLSVCSDHARNHGNHQASEGGTQTKPNKAGILPTIKSTSEGAKKTPEKSKVVEDKDKRRKDKGKLSSSNPATSTPEKSEASLQANNNDSIPQTANNTQDDEDLQIKQSGSVVEGNNNGEQGLNDVDQEVAGTTEGVAMDLEVPKQPDTQEEDEEQQMGEELIKEEDDSQSIQTGPNQSRKNIVEFLQLDIENELKAKKDGVVKNEDDGREVMEDEHTETDVKDNVQYITDEITLDAKETIKDVKEDKTSKVEEKEEGGRKIEIKKEQKEGIMGETGDAITKEDEIVGKKEEQIKEDEKVGNKEEKGDDENIGKNDETMKEDGEKVGKNEEQIKEGDEKVGKKEEIVKEDDEKVGNNEEQIKEDEKKGIDPMPSFNEWKQQQLELNEQEKMKLKANDDGQPVATPRHNAKLSNKNYASVDCGAKIVDSNKESKGTASAILSSNRDEYMLNPCAAKIWFTVEMCEPIQVKRVEIANLELFSSTPESFKVFTSDRHPTSYWREVGLFYARDERSLQTFTVHDETLFTKFIKVEFLTFFGKEHYCPISLLRVFGTSMEEEIDDESEQIDPSPPEVLPVHPTVSPEDTSGDGLFDSVIKIVKEAAKAFHAEVRIPAVVEDIRKDELLLCFPYSNGVRRTNNTPKKVLSEDTDERMAEAKQQHQNTSGNKTVQDSLMSPSPPIIQHIGCKSCEYSFRPHYGDIFHKCHLVKLSISEFGLYFCCYDAPNRTLIYTGAIGLKASTINQCNGTNAKMPNSVNISSKVIEGSAVSVSMQSINVQSAVNAGLESTPVVGVPSGIDPSKETPPLSVSTFYEESDDKSKVVINSISLPKDTDTDKNSQTPEEVSSKNKPVIAQEESPIKEVPIHTEALSNGIKDSPVAVEIAEGDPVTDGHSEIIEDTLKLEKKNDQIKVESRPIEAESIKEPASETSSDDGVKPSGDAALPDVKEQSSTDSADSIPTKSSEVAPASTSKPNGSNGHENSTKPKADSLAGNSFGIGIPKESVLMRLNNRIKSLEVNLSLSTGYLQELSQRYKKQMDDMRKMYDTKVAKLYEDAMIAEEKKQIEAEHVKELQGEIKKLKTSIHDINATLEGIHKQTFESHFFFMLVEVTIVCFLLICTRSCRQVPETTPTVPQATPLTTPVKGHSRRNSYSGRISNKNVLKPPNEGVKLEEGCQELLIIEPPTPIRQASLQANENMKNRRLKNKQKQKNNLKSSSSSNLKKDNKKLKTGSSKAGSISSAGLLFGVASGKESSKKQNGACNGNLHRPKSTENISRIQDVGQVKGQDRFNFCNGY